MLKFTQEELSLLDIYHLDAPDLASMVKQLHDAFQYTHDPLASELITSTLEKLNKTTQAEFNALDFTTVEYL